MSTFLIEQPANYEHERPRKHRATLTRPQLVRLTDEFDRNNNPSMDLRVRLAAELDMETKQISSWFQNRRQSIKNRLSGSSASPQQYLLQPTSSQDPPSPTDPIPMPRFQSTFHVHHPSSSMATDTAEITPLGVVAPTDSTKQEPHDLVFHSSVSARGSPTPSEASVTSYHSHSLPSSYPPTRTLAHPTRSSTRARSARLASSPIPVSNAAATAMAGAAASAGHTHRRTGSSGTTGTSRARMSEAQRDVLQEYYDSVDPSPSMEERQRLATQTGLEISKVTNWFRNLRQAMRKAKMRDEELRATGAMTGSSPHVTPYGAAASASAHALATSRPIPIPIAHRNIQGEATHHGRAGTHTHHTHTHTQHHTASRSRPRHPTRYPSVDGESSSAEEDDDEESDTMEAITPWASPDTKVEHSFQPTAQEMRLHSHTSVPQSPPMFPDHRRLLPIPHPHHIPNSATPSPYSRFSPLPVQIVSEAGDGDEEFEIDIGGGKTRRVDGAEVRDALLLLHFKRGGVGHGVADMDGVRSVKF